MPQLTGGLARFHTNAAFFPHAWQDHSNTETAPGHATMLSGREPVHTEIISNNRGVPDVTAPLVAASGAGASPRRFNGTTLYDWILARDSSARVLSVSRKDRGAILPIGRAKGDVYWFADGKFTTSRYYADTLPTWVRDFDARHPVSAPRRNAMESAACPRVSTPNAIQCGPRTTAQISCFLIRCRRPTLLRSRLQQYPWMDSLTLAIALDGVRATQVGKRSMASTAPNTMPDLLSISLSTTDAVGHAFGPDSREIHDQVLRVDRWLGEFMVALEREVPAQRIIYVLTADHGIAPMPEIAAATTGRGGRLWLGDIVRSSGVALESRYRTEFNMEFDNGLVYADVAAMRARGINVDSVARAIVAEGTSRAGVSVGFTPTTLATSSDSVAVRWRRTLPPNVGWIAAFGASANYVWSAAERPAPSMARRTRSVFRCRSRSSAPTLRTVVMKDSFGPWTSRRRSPCSSGSRRRSRSTARRWVKSCASGRRRRRDKVLPEGATRVILRKPERGHRMTRGSALRSRFLRMTLLHGTQRMPVVNHER